MSAQPAFFGRQSVSSAYVTTFIMPNTQLGKGEKFLHSCGNMKTSMRDRFIQAVIDNDCDIVRAELANGRDPNAPDQYGWIPLHRAAANDSADVIQILLDAGSSLTAVGTDSWTPLHLAAVSSSTEAVRLLVKAGANIHTDKRRYASREEIKRAEFK